MRYIAGLLAFLGVMLAVPALSQERDEIPAEVTEFLDSLNPVSGDIAIAEADATLDLGEEYIFYNAEDAKRILTQLWGNPPESSGGNSWTSNARWHNCTFG